MKGLRLFRRTRGSWTSLHPPPDDVDERSGARHGMGPRARRSSPRATQTRGPVAGTTRLDRRHEPGRAQPTRTGHVAKQVLLVIGVAQVITRALSRLDEMALREETQTLLRGLDTLAAGLPIGSSVRSRSWSTSIEMRRRRSDAACSRPYAPGARRLATPATRTPRSAARENRRPAGSGATLRRLGAA